MAYGYTSGVKVSELTLATSFNDWKPIRTAPRFRPVEIGGWYAGIYGLKWTTEIAVRRLFSWTGDKYPRHSHWRELPSAPAYGDKND